VVVGRGQGNRPAPGTRSRRDSHGDGAQQDGNKNCRDHPAGLGLGIVLLEQLLPGSRAVTPLAGNLIARGYSRSEEYAADRHGVTLLNRAGYSKDVLINALNWVSRSSAGSGGGFLSTHPATDDRIEELRRLA